MNATRADIGYAARVSHAALAGAAPEVLCAGEFCVVHKHGRYWLVRAQKW